MYTYRTYFKLTASVIDFDAAQSYLTEDDMTIYLKDDNRINSNIRDSIQSITWILKDENSGHIDLISERILTGQELLSISDWVSGQNSDGLGEGFEQQEFANYSISEQEGSYYDEDYYEDEDDWVMASFDWQTNKYIFELESTED